jgi:two-component system C4-dicarboxylate transport sensor histidine kinase DctB
MAVGLSFPTLATRWHAAPVVPLALLGVAIVLSSHRLVAAPGFELILAPFAYLPALRWYGVRAAIAVAIATTLPTLAWFGQPLLIAAALGHIAVVDRFCRGDRGLSTVTVLYSVAIASVAAGLLLHNPWGLAAEAALIAFLRTVLFTVAAAAITDAAVLFIARDPSTGGLMRRPLVSLTGALDVLVSLTVAGGAMLFLLGAMRSVPDQMLRFADQARTAAALAPAADRPTGQIRALPMPGRPDALRMTHTPQADAASAAARLGCRRIDDGTAAAIERQTIGYWLTTCVAQRAPDGHIAIVSPRPFVRATMVGVFMGLIPLLAYLLLAELGLVAFRHAIRRSVAVWEDALAHFDRHAPIPPVDVPFSETHTLLDRFVTINNALLASDHERQRLARAVDELRTTMGFKVFSDVRYDASSGSLRFVKIDPQHGRREMSLPVHPADRPTLANLDAHDDVMAEFRVGSGAEAEWHLLLAHEHDPIFERWRFGCVVRLRTAKAFQTEMRHHARLMELGGMASALSHELRQPLFTIALAAENGRLSLTQSDEASGRAAQKFDRIIEQVDRATAIVERTSGYARLERGGSEPISIIDAIQNAARFMRPVLSERDIALRITAPASLPILELPRVGIEQIIVNALQNAADSIDTARAAGDAGPARIAIDLAQRDRMVEVVIDDTGTGLADAVAGTAFDAFSTTKPIGKGTGLGLFVCRQIMDEVGGTIALADKPDGRGAMLTLSFPIDARR